MTFKGALTEEFVRHAAQLDCANAGIDEVEGKVYDENDDYLTSDAWDCEDHQGTIEEVLAGENRKVVILGGTHRAISVTEVRLLASLLSQVRQPIQEQSPRNLAFLSSILHQMAL